MKLHPSIHSSCHRAYAYTIFPFTNFLRASTHSHTLANLSIIFGSRCKHTGIHQPKSMQMRKKEQEKRGKVQKHECNASHEHEFAHTQTQCHVHNGQNRDVMDIKSHRVHRSTTPSTRIPEKPSAILVRRIQRVNVAGDIDQGMVFSLSPFIAHFAGNINCLG